MLAFGVHIAKVGALVLLGVSPASAEVLKVRHVDSTNLHLAESRGAIHTSVDLTVTVDLGAKGRVDVSSTGMRGESNMYVVDDATYNTDDKTTWTTSWKGTWKKSKDSLVLALVLVKDACSATREEGGAKTARTCKGARKSAVLRCASSTVEIDVGAKKTMAPAWSCASDDPRDLGESPLTWVMGKARCIEMHGGRKTPLSFAPCREP